MGLSAHLVFRKFVSVVVIALDRRGVKWIKDFNVLSSLQIPDTRGFSRSLVISSNRGHGVVQKALVDLTSFVITLAEVSVKPDPELRKGCAKRDSYGIIARQVMRSRLVKINSREQLMHETSLLRGHLQKYSNIIPILPNGE